MADESHVVRGIDWNETFPFTGLFKGFRVAIHPSKLLLALAGLILIFMGGKVLDWIWLAPAVPNELEMYAQSQSSATPAADFEASRKAAWNRMKGEYTDRLKMIGKDNGWMGDLKDEIVRVRDKRIEDINSQFNNLANKDDPARRQERDNAITAVYAAAAEEWEDTQKLNGVGLFHTFYGHEVRMINQTVAAVARGNWLGEAGVISSTRSFFILAPTWAIRHHWFFFTLFFFYFLCVWSIFGGAIARIAAVHVARDEKIAIRQALRFSTSKFLSFLSAPIIPGLILLAIGLVVAVGGLLMNIPFLGPIVVGVFFPLALAAGFVMTLVLIGTAGGFNLMYPTIAVEGSDSFDAISRSFSYLYARPWRLAFYSAVSMLYGSICYLFVRCFIRLLLQLTHIFVGLLVFTNADNAAPLWNAIWPAPLAGGSLNYNVTYLTLGAGQSIGAFFVSIWVFLVVAVLGAFGISFYFSANTIIYYLMRREVDATELDDVYIEQTDEDFAETTPASASSSAGADSSTASESANTDEIKLAPAPETSAEEPPQV